jgi:beta-N-acetylhexosaminidase
MRIFYLIILLSCILSSERAQADSLDIKIGQMLMVDFQGKRLNEESLILQDVKRGFIGGVLIYERNLDSFNTVVNLKKLTSLLQKASLIPLLISIDEEGGQVNRLKEKYGFSAMPSAKDVGNRHSDRYTAYVATLIATALSSCGINLNYSPVLDVDNPKCPALGKYERCYSSNPDTIAHDAAITIMSHHKKGVRTVVKHFPGHGNCLSDPHIGLADVSNTWSEEELKPFSLLIDKNLVDAIMTAHVVNRQLDSSGLPATLSKKIISGLLRTDMKYNGVVISDHIQMKAIRDIYGLQESLRLCINAGVDIIMFSNNNKNTPEYIPSNVHAIIKKLVNDGEISMDRINESYERIMVLKKRL